MEIVVIGLWPVGTLAKNFGAASPGWAVDVAAGETWNGKL